MTAPDDPLDLDSVIRCLGHELRVKRAGLDLSRHRAVAQFARVAGEEISDRTLLAYENGIRDLSVRRLLQLCATYEASPVLVLAAAIHRANNECCRECGR